MVEATFLHRDKCYHAGDVADEGKVDDFQHQVEIVALGGEHLLLRFLVHLVARGVEPLLVALHLKFHAAHVGQVVVQFLLVLPAEPTVEALGLIRDVVEYALVTRLHVPESGLCLGGGLHEEPLENRSRVRFGGKRVATLAKGHRHDPLVQGPHARFAGKVEARDAG